MVELSASGPADITTNYSHLQPAFLRLTLNVRYLSCCRGVKLQLHSLAIVIRCCPSVSSVVCDARVLHGESNCCNW